MVSKTFVHLITKSILLYKVLTYVQMHVNVSLLVNLLGLLAHKRDILKVFSALPNVFEEKIIVSLSGK